MELTHAFEIQAPPDLVFEHLLDVRRVAECIPGVEVTEMIDERSFRGRIRVKVGPISVGYEGVGRILDIDPIAHRAIIEGNGDESGSSGSVRARATISVESSADISRILITTDLAIAGRVAQFGRTVIDQVAKRMIGSMGTCLQEQLRAERTADPLSTASS